MPASHDANDERAALDLLVRGFQVSRMLRLVADLGVADRIAPDARVTISELSVDCGAHAQPLIRVLRALASIRRLHGDGRRRNRAHPTLPIAAHGYAKQHTPFRPLLGRVGIMERLGNA